MKSLSTYRGLFLSILGIVGTLIASVLAVKWFTQPNQTAASYGATWNSITIGRSTSKDVIAVLGSPVRQEAPILNIPQTQILYYAVHNDSVGITIELKEDKVIYIRDNSPQMEARTLSSFIVLYGKPDFVTWSTWASHTGRIVVFASDGLVLKTLSDYPTPDEAYISGGGEYFIPCSLQCILERYKYLIANGPVTSEDPRPAQDPWGITK